MISYFSLRDMLLNGNDIETAINEVLKVTIKAKSHYPEYANWFMNTHVPGIYAGTRDTIIAVYYSKIIGVSNIKIQDEKKICTLYFEDKFRKQGLGKILVDESIKVLETEKPLITMPTEYLPQFQKLIKRYKWELTDCIDSCYKKDVSELIFNGELSPINSCLTNDERIVFSYSKTKDKNILKLLSSPIPYIKYRFNSKKSAKKSKKVLSN